MKALKAMTLILILLAVSIPVVSQKPSSTDGSIFGGRSFSFVLKEPNGWTMDIETARSQGLQVVLYPDGSSWNNAAAVMYARVIDKDEDQSTIDKVISNDVADFMKLSKESTVSDSPPLETRDKSKSISKVFYDAANKNYETVTFIDGSKVVVILALSSRQKTEYDKALPAFKALVGSYFVFTPLGSP